MTMCRTLIHVSMVAPIPAATFLLHQTNGDAFLRCNPNDKPGAYKYGKKR